MSKVKLVFCCISEIVGSNGMAVIRLSDEKHLRTLSIVCDSIMKYQIGLRCTDVNLQNRLLPEVLTCIVNDNLDMNRFVVDVHNVEDGEYRAVVKDIEANNEYPIRFSDAVLFSLICNVCIYMDEVLFIQQSLPYTDISDKLAIPINTIDTERLVNELQKAIDSENYRLASQIQTELNKRKENG